LDEPFTKFIHDTYPRCRRVLNEAVFAWCLRSAQYHMRQHAMEPALQWALLAARSAVHHGFGELVSPDLEAALLEIAQGLPVPHSAADNVEIRARRWLHVMDKAYSIGGHTALVERWVRFDPTDSVHSVTILSQSGDVPANLAEAVSQRRGVLRVLRPDTPLLEKAHLLRQDAWDNADTVVLHVHPYSVVPLVAFGISGGPPIVLLNHLSQHFWLGAAVADLVISLRPSAMNWTRRYRGIDRTVMLPIPFSPRVAEPGNRTALQVQRQKTRALLGIPHGAPVFLTVGSGYKYLQLPSLDFLQAARSILDRLPDAHLIAVGPRQDEARWKEAQILTNGRLHVPGHTMDLGEYHAAADIYLEGYPIGSPTALFEVVEQGIPCVRAPRAAPPPFAADGVALEAIDQPKDTAEYIERSVALGKDACERHRLGAVLADAVRANHSENSWVQRYRELQALLPRSHQTYPVRAPECLPAEIRNLIVAISTLHHDKDTLTYTSHAAAKLGLDPRPDRQFLANLFRCVLGDPTSLKYLVRVIAGQTRRIRPRRRS
jgi:glycosyltransferase involved in cell wall biosynthesis